MSATVRLDPADNVVSAVKPLEVGAEAEPGVAATALIPRGHKIATQAIAKGEVIRKYAQIIGYAAADIGPGDHVHSHNVEFRNTDVDYEFSTDLRPVAPAATPDTFMGFRRPSGKVGTRNYVAVLTSVNCSATAACTVLTSASTAMGVDREKMPTPREKRKMTHRSFRSCRSTLTSRDQGEGP